LKLYVWPLDIARSYSINNIAPLIFEGVHVKHVKSVKHSSLVRNILWIEIFVQSVVSCAVADRACRGASVVEGERA